MEWNVYYNFGILMEQVYYADSLERLIKRLSMANLVDFITKIERIY